MTRLWRLKGKVETTLLDNKIFVFRFTCEEDKQKILETSIWKIARRPLLLRAWNPDIEMERINLQSILVWVSLPGLPFQFWSGENLSVIGSVLGKPLYTDRHTKSRERLSYARLCVKVYAGNSFQDSIVIQTEDERCHTQKVVYDWKLVRCSACVCFGHGDSQCPKQKKTKQVWRVKTKKIIEEPHEQNDNINTGKGTIVQQAAKIFKSPVQSPKFGRGWC